MQGLPVPGRMNIVIRTVLICIPLLAGLLWIVSGREILTKTGKPVEVIEIDAFGDPNPIIHFEPGRVFGYYVGLDAVAGTAALSLFAATVLWWRQRRRRRRSQSSTERTAKHAQA